MRTKKDIVATISKFTQFASFDEVLQKHYVVFEDRKRKGVWTLMLKEGQWSVHGKGADYCDEGETFLSEKEVVDFIWSNRATFRQSMLVLQK